ncbi:restriction endonuclease, partial [Salmonella enterica]|nr:restriction endonuclease [Salmonella enterica]EBO4925382.1 restriction endonuclease [Salmonella enterica]ECK2675060.1 restriction endonuclease [Salmonella enterica]
RLITRVDHTINSMDLQSPGNTKTI